MGFLIGETQEGGKGTTVVELSLLYSLDVSKVEERKW